jgi:hypothetical protein
MVDYPACFVKATESARVTLVDKGIGEAAEIQQLSLQMELITLFHDYLLRSSP